ncbi:phosphatase PAP2 family protein [Natrialbaceae archaeon GCM10025810]|uniref:phosphatase PAP2 family protein n=1 Tax=Halovalidus salilacus TaxID=3075124 RepID=UPI00361076A3
MLGQVLSQLSLIVAVMVLVSVAAFVGWDRLAATRREWRARVRAVAPAVAVLVAVLLSNSVAREAGPDVSWMIDWNITWTIYDLEGGFILWLQSFETAWLTAYFSFTYIYVYVFLMAFPVIAYFALSDTRPLRELLTAYTLNYVLGLFLYVVIISYGPRNMMPELVDALLYDTYPEYQHLTRQVNRNTNVFPSLHASLSATVLLLAHRTRDEYPKWFALAVPLAASVALSTMYLGIHWAIDVLAGFGLAYVSVALSTHLVGRWSVADALERRLGSIRGRDARGNRDGDGNEGEVPAVRSED